MNATTYMQLEQQVLVVIAGMVLANVLVAMLWLKTWVKGEYDRKLKEML